MLVLDQPGISQTGEIMLTVAMEGDDGGSRLCTQNQCKGKMLCNIILIRLPSRKHCKL